MINKIYIKEISEDYSHLNRIHLYLDGLDVKSLKGGLN